MRYIGIIILLVLCLILLLFTGCRINADKPETASGNLENQEEINQSSNNSQSSLTGPVEEPVIVDTEETVTVYPKQWATGDGTAENPWANDCINKALDFVPTGGTIFLKAGYYILSDVVSITKKINIIGEGMNKTIIRTAGGTANGFYSTGVDYITIKNLTIDGDAQTDNTLYQAVIAFNSGCNYVSLENLEIMNGGRAGLDYYEGNYSSFKNIYAHDNYSTGVHPGSDTTGKNMYNTYRDIYAWHNGRNGFDDRGIGIEPFEQLNNVFDNIQCWDNTEKGIAIGQQKGAALSNLLANGNSGSTGIYLYNLEDSNVSDCLTTLNELEGLTIIDSKNVNLTNVISKNNNVSNTGSISGIRVENSSGIKFMSCQSYDDRDTPLQLYGIELYGTNTGISLLNCKLTPNKEGEIYNPAGVVYSNYRKEGVSPSVIVR
jgi:hypothetical protein